MVSAKCASSDGYLFFAYIGDMHVRRLDQDGAGGSSMMYGTEEEVRNDLIARPFAQIVAINMHGVRLNRMGSEKSGRAINREAMRNATFANRKAFAFRFRIGKPVPA